MSAINPPIYPPVSLDPGMVPWGVPQHMPGRSMNAALRTAPLGASSMPQSGDLQAVAMRDPHHYASLVSQYLAIGNGVSAKILDAPNGKRNILMLRNSSALANIYIECGKDATLFSVLRMVPNQIILFDVVVPQDDLYALADAANGVLSFSYSTIL